MKRIIKILEKSNDTTTNTVYLDQVNGDDSTAVRNNSTAPAKTLQGAINLAVQFSPCTILITSDYVISGTEMISKTDEGKVIITCDEGVSITGLSSGVTTDLQPTIIDNDGVYEELASSCNMFDVANYINFSILTIESHTIESSINCQTVTMSVPNGYNISAGVLLEINTGWVTALGKVLSVANGVMTVYIESSNYEIVTTSSGKYRFLNYNEQPDTFVFTENNGVYTVQKNGTIKTPQSSFLYLFKVLNLVFKNCNFVGLNNGTRGLLLDHCYSIRIEDCSFEYCNVMKMWSSIDVTIDNCYFYRTDIAAPATGKHIFIRNSLFKTSMISSVYSSITIEHNTFCYSKKAISGGIGRRDSFSQAVDNMVLIQFNEFHHIGMLLQGDYGVIYRYGQGKMIVQYNYIHDCCGRTTNGSISGIYCDEGAYGILCRYNLIVNTTRSSYTHFGRGNVFYNNIFAYSVINHIIYGNTNKLTYEGGTSYLANIFVGGTIELNYLDLIDKDGGMFQMNAIDTDYGFRDTFNRHSNIIEANLPFTDAANGDFSLTQPYKKDKVSMGSTNVRHFSQSTIDTSFFDLKDTSDTYHCGLPAESKWASYEDLNLSLEYYGNTYTYDKWFILYEMELFNVSNEYLINKSTDNNTI